MKKRFIGVASCFLLLTATLIASCSTSTVSTSNSTTTSRTATSTTQSTTSKTTANVTTTNPTTTSATGNWWDSLGTPQYGGTFTLRIATEPTQWDPYAFPGEDMSENWLEMLGGDNWTLDPKDFSYSIIFRPDAYEKGLLAKSWELTTPDTLTYYLRKGIYWQNLPPANGRELVASDVVFHYQRMYGLGSGMTPSPFWSNVTPLGQDLVSVVATDNYTVVFKWKTPNPEFFLQSMEPLTHDALIECPEAVKQWGDLNDWHHAIGTGAFILTDYTEGATLSMVSNPNYWGHDERYPQNQLPYISKFYVNIINDEATASAALGSGKIDAYDTVPLNIFDDLKATNPDMQFYTNPDQKNTSLSMRNDLKPFSDIRVRTALQMAINLQSIASDYLKGTVSGTPLTITSYYAKGFGFQYDQWPQTLKDQYAYNPTAAKQLLADAGYPNGFNTDCVIVDTADMGMLEIVQAEFADIGVKMDIVK